MPAYKKVLDGAMSPQMPSAITSDGKKWLAIVKGIGHVYDIDSGKWSIELTVHGQDKSAALGAATDPDTGIIFIPFGYYEEETYFGQFFAQERKLSMLMVNMTDYTLTTDGRNVSTLDQNAYAVAWSQPLRSLLYVAGSNLYSYNATGGWRDLRSAMVGDIPSARINAKDRAR
ncbi:hypothetical protein BGZ65_003293 [Modicella reniformis]|uniref:Uncharacterized protein n=1 Tax=Modicella reniformis TaxID=1440133 RepID=A0A9P6MBK6_9FUNG|nr:hypothetical protein BGZ65_003293 [Modicella reniformis]